MTTGLPADVLGILRQTRHLLLDFDGPVCDIFTGLPAPVVAARLKELAGLHLDMPAELAESDDPLHVFAFVAAADRDLGARVEAEMTELECAAVDTARPTPYVHEVVTAARDSGRSVGVVSNNSERAVRAYLGRQGLDTYVDLVVARTSPDPALLKPSPHLIGKALAILGAKPSEAAFVGDSDTDILAACQAAVPAIGYANRPGKPAILAEAGAGAVVTSLADLVLVLRASSAPRT
jgi:phosphoglycolate phosphatase-like HAD superfamily hydrolase